MTASKAERIVVSDKRAEAPSFPPALFSFLTLPWLPCVLVITGEAGRSSHNEEALHTVFGRPVTNLARLGPIPAFCTIAKWEILLF